MKIRAWLAILCSVLGALVILSTVVGVQTIRAQGDLELPRFSVPNKGNPKLDSRLNQLISASNSPAQLASFAQQNDMGLVGDRIRVIIETSPGQKQSALEAAKALGSIETDYRDSIQLLVAPPQLAALANSTAVQFVRTPYQAVPTVVSEGVALSQASSWQSAGVNGAGVKIGVLDGGFSGFSARQSSGELPSTISTWWAPSIGGPGSSAHGTACAEIIYDMAPGAQLYLANLTTDVEIGNAVDWMISQGVTIISHSMGWPISGPGNGTGPIDAIVDRARSAGVLWVNSAGNSAQRHWQGNWVNTNGNQYNEFAPGDETNTISASAGAVITALLKWNDPWGASSNDYDLLLFDNSSPPNLVALSDLSQNGNAYPIESLSYVATYTGSYQIAIGTLGTPTAVNFHLYTFNQDLQYQTPSNSLLIPSDSANALTAGAVYWNSPSTLENFSSQGPTTDGRVKPDLVAPDGVSTATYGAGNFYGTSASAPHAAGAAALVKQLYPTYSPAQIQSFLEAKAIDLGAAGKDNTYGSGRLALGTLPPTVATGDATNPVFNGGRLNGNLTSKGTASSVGVAFEWGVSTGNLPNTTTAQTLSSTGSFYFDLGNLLANTTYYFRAKAVGDSVSYGVEKSFKTLPTIAPAVTTDNSSHLTSYSAQLTGTLSSRGTASSANTSFLWGASLEALDETPPVVTSAAGPFSADLTSLSANTTYYYQAKAAGHGTTLGEVKSFETLPGLSMDPMVEPTGRYYRAPPSLSKLRFSDSSGLDDGWYKVDSSAWTPFFANSGEAEWSAENWTIPGFDLMSEGSHTVFFRATNDGDQSGDWSWQFYKDTAAPLGPSDLSSPTHTPSIWSGNTTVTVTWAAASDSNSGLAGYSTEWSNSSTTVPDDSLEISDNTTTTTTSPALASGNTTYFHIRAIDRAGNAGPTTNLGPFFIDTVLPEGPTGLASTSHTPSTWSSSNTITVAWPAATDNLSGLKNYLTLWDTTATGVPTSNNVSASSTNVTSPPLDDGARHYFHIRAVDQVGNLGEVKTLGPFSVDTQGPASPTIASSTPAMNVWSNNQTVTITWTASADAASGLDGYSSTWDNSPTSDPGTTRALAGEATTSVQSGTDGTHYFHIRPVDKLGNWGAPAHFGPFLIETVPPSAPATNLISTTHTPGVWSNVTAISVNWTAAQDTTSGIGGYSILWNTSDNTNAPATQTTGNVTSATSPALADGNNHWVHIRAVDRAGNWSNNTAHFGPFWIETAPPTGPTDISVSHPVATWSSNATVTANWTAATDAASGLAGYAVVWDTSPDTRPAAMTAENTTTSNVTSLVDGTSHYLHIRALDKAGNWGTTSTFGPFYIDVYSPVLSGGSVSPSSGYQSASYTFSVVYGHPEAQAPADVKVSIDGGAPATMALATGQTGNYTRVQTFSLTVSGTSLSVGNHAFAFSATDNASNPALGDVGQHFGPAIQSPPTPPPSGGFSGGLGGSSGGGVSGPGATNITMYTNSDGLFNLAAVIKSDDGKAYLTIAKGVVARTKDDSALKSIKIVPAENPAAMSAGNNMVGLAYEITPEGATFSPAIALTLIYDPAKLPANTDLDSLAVVVYNSASSQWESLKSVANKSEGSVTADVGHFSVYALVAKPLAPPPPTTTASVPTTVPAPPSTQPAPATPPTPTPTPMSIQTPSPTPSATSPAALNPTPGSWATLIIAIVAGFIVFGLIGFVLVKARRSKAKRT